MIPPFISIYHHNLLPIGKAKPFCNGFDHPLEVHV